MSDQGQVEFHHYCELQGSGRRSRKLSERRATLRLCRCFGSFEIKSWQSRTENQQGLPKTLFVLHLFPNPPTQLYKPAASNPPLVNVSLNLETLWENQSENSRSPAHYTRHRCACVPRPPALGLAKPLKGPPPPPVVLVSFFFS